MKEYTNEVIEKIKRVLSVYPRVNVVTYNNGTVEVTPNTIITSNQQDIKSIEVITVNEVFTKYEQEINNIQNWVGVPEAVKESAITRLNKKYKLA